jgi:hypothetical protein
VLIHWPCINDILFGIQYFKEWHYFCNADAKVILFLIYTNHFESFFIAYFKRVVIQFFNVKHFFRKLEDRF